jgi:hypothetical protein
MDPLKACPLQCVNSNVIASDLPRNITGQIWCAGFNLVAWAMHAANTDNLDAEMEVVRPMDTSGEFSV